jgi:hypothetical protein
MVCIKEYKKIKSVLLVVLLSATNAFLYGGAAGNDTQRSDHDLPPYLINPLMYSQTHLPSAKETKKYGVWDITTIGIKQGLQNALLDTTKSTAVHILKPIPQGAASFIAFIAAHIYRLSFGSRGLTWNDLAKVSNLIYSRCLPFTSVSAGSFDKKRRGELVGQDQQLLPQDTSWQEVQEALVQELYHAITFLRKALPCYDLNQAQNPSNGLKHIFARIIQSWSSQNNEQVSFYIIRTMFYIDKLIETIKSFRSFEEAQQKYEVTRRWLNYTCSSFEQVAFFLDNDEAGQSRKGIPFLKVNAQAGGGVPSLVDSFLGSPMGSLHS